MNGWERVKCQTRMIVAASLIISVAECCICSVKDRKVEECVPANMAGNFSCEVVGYQCAWSRQKHTSQFAYCNYSLLD